MEQEIFHIAKFREGSDRDLETLEQGYIWFSDVESLNDPFEGRASLINSSDIERKHKNLPLIKEIYSNRFYSKGVIREHESYIMNSLELLEATYDIDKKIFLDLANTTYEIIANAHINSVRDNSFIFSASNADDKKIIRNPLLWGTYGSSFSGICIIYRLDELLRTNNEVVFSEVNYDRKPTLTDDILEDLAHIKTNQSYTHPIVTKSSHWKHEKEIRLLSNKSGKHFFNASTVKEVYISEKMTLRRRERIIDICNKKHKKCKIKLAFYNEKIDDIDFKNIKT